MQCDFLVCYVQDWKTWYNKKHRKDRNVLHCSTVFCLTWSLALMDVLKDLVTLVSIPVLHFSQFDPCFQGSILLLQVVGANSNQVPAISFRVYPGCEKHIEWRSFRSEGFHLSKIMEGEIGRIQINLMASRLNSYKKSKNWHVSWSTVATMFTALKSMLGYHSWTNYTKETAHISKEMKSLPFGS